MKLIATNQTSAILQMSPEEYEQARPFIPAAIVSVMATVTHDDVTLLSGSTVDTRPYADPPAQIPTTFALPAHLAEGGQ